VLAGSVGWFNLPKAGIIQLPKSVNEHWLGGKVGKEKGVLRKAEGVFLGIQKTEPFVGKKPTSR